MYFGCLGGLGFELGGVVGFGTAPPQAETQHADMSWTEREKARETVERIFLELEMPNLSEKQAWNAEDPLASVHNYLVNMRVNLPLLYGVRAQPTC